MALPLLIPLVSSLASIVPAIAEWLGGDEAESTAGKIVKIAKAVTGFEDPESAISAIREDPAFALEFEKAMLGFKVAIEGERTKQLGVVNQTMRTEGASKYFLVRTWRPFWGYLSALAFAGQMIGFIWIGLEAVRTDPIQAVMTINALAGLAFALAATWGVALTVLGVMVKSRSEDKAVEAGLSPAPGILKSLASKFLGVGQPAATVATAMDEKVFAAGVSPSEPWPHKSGLNYDLPDGAG